MDKLLRRIVTGLDQYGNSVFESDDVPPVTFSVETEWPGYNNVELWQTNDAMPKLSDVYHRDALEKYDFDIPAGVARFCTMRLPPLKKLIAHQEQIGKSVDLKTFGMHRTNTVDYLVLLEGEVTLILNNGEEKTLKPGDTVVQKGNLHTWHNRGDVDCLMACVMIGANNGGS